MKTLAISELIKLAAQGRILIPGELSGYLVLSALEALDECDVVRLCLARIDLSDDGQVFISQSEGSTADRSSLELRDVLAVLLNASTAVPAALRRVGASGAPSSSLIQELTTALIPLNRGAARRGLARLCREGLAALREMPLAEAAGTGSHTDASTAGTRSRASRGASAQGAAGPSARNRTAEQDRAACFDSAPSACQPLDRNVPGPTECALVTDSVERSMAVSCRDDSDSQFAEPNQSCPDSSEVRRGAASDSGSCPGGPLPIAGTDPPKPFHSECSSTENSTTEPVKHLPAVVAAHQVMKELTQRLEVAPETTQLVSAISRTVALALVVTDEKEASRECTQRLEVVPEAAPLVSTTPCTVALAPVVADEKEARRECTQRLEVVSVLPVLEVPPSSLGSLATETGPCSAIHDIRCSATPEASMTQFATDYGVDAFDESLSVRELPDEGCASEHTVGETSAPATVDWGSDQSDGLIEVTSPLELVRRRVVASVDCVLEGLGGTRDSCVPGPPHECPEHRDVTVVETADCGAWRNDKLSSEVSQCADGDPPDKATDADMTVIPLGSYELRYLSTETTETSLCHVAIHEQSPSESTDDPDVESSGCGLEELLSQYGARMQMNQPVVRTTTEYRSHMLRHSMAASDTEALAAKLSAHASWEDPELGRSLRALAGLEDSRLAAHVRRDAQCKGADCQDLKGQV